MVYHAVFFAPLRFTTSACFIVTSFGLHYAHIAAGKFSHADETVALRVAFFRLLPTGTTENIPSMDQG